ncbi:SAF domain-containing protein [Microbacterium sp.]|uniref:SAF domain-containing protein n=1 Tax=Microbacterium sp. TaxID=51671 RepID=UPI0025DAA7FD|nr:SAF domain-containing protein [Microbacterium sp.]
MSETAPARPRPRAFWSDVRFLVGVGLIVVSIAGVWVVVAAARQTVPVFAASRTIVPGEIVTSGDLQVVEVALGRIEDAYASPASFEPGSVALRTVTAGELVPRTAIGAAEQARTTTVVVTSATALPAAVGAGTTVEVWAAPQIERGVFDVPRILVASATVVSVDDEASVMGSAGRAVELVIERADVADTLAAVAAGASMSIVPTAGIAR